MKKDPRKRGRQEKALAYCDSVQTGFSIRKNPTQSRHNLLKFLDPVPVPARYPVLRMRFCCYLFLVDQMSNGAFLLVKVKSYFEF
jgi:hypothetical protein